MPLGNTAPAGRSLRCTMKGRCVSGVPHDRPGSRTRFPMRMPSPPFSLHLLSSEKRGTQPSRAPLRPRGWCGKWGAGSLGTGGKAAGIRWVTLRGPEPPAGQPAPQSSGSKPAVVSDDPTSFSGLG